MSKVIVTWCDPCSEEDVENVATSFQISLDGSEARELDLCDSHQQTILGPIRLLLADFGQPVEEQKASRKPRANNGAVKPFIRPECKQEIASRDSLGKHLRRQHSKSLAGVDEASILNPANTTGELACTECPRTFDRAQGLGVHLSKVHGVLGARHDSQEQLAS